MPKLLIVDDEQANLEALIFTLKKKGYDIQTAQDGKEGLDRFKESPVDLIIADVRMPRMDGLEMLREVRKINPLLPVIMLTGHGNIEQGIQSMKEGAFHYLEKPPDRDLIMLQVQKALDDARMRQQLTHLQDENEYLKTEIDDHYPFKNIIGYSPAIKQVFDLIQRVAPSTTTVLITGESGTGKELAARAIHDSSPRRNQPMIKVNCVAIPDTLLESELFGHVKGAFTDASYTKLGKFELANGGTIFLDEIGDMSFSLQGKILRVLQEREFESVGGTTVKKVDVRVITATNRILSKLVKENKFREDLYFRLNVVPIHLPSLRERKQDIPKLIKYFIPKFCREMGKKIDGISSQALDSLLQYDYPGNIRELQNLIERAVVLCLGKQLDISDFQFQSGQSSLSNIFPQYTAYSLPYKEAKREVLENFEKKYFIEALRKASGSVTKASEQTGMHRKNFYEKLVFYNIEPKDYQP